MWYCYTLRSDKNGRLYIGATDNLKRRLEEHNSGTGGKYTQKNRPLTLIFYEAYLSKKDALRAEKFYKMGYGREILKGKLESYFSENQT